MQISLPEAIKPRLAFAVPSSFDRYKEFLLIYIVIICKVSKGTFIFFRKTLSFFTEQNKPPTKHYFSIEFLDAPCSVQS